MQEKIKLSDWAETNGKTYRQAWELYNKGELPVKTTTNKKGSIFVIKESRASENKEKQKVDFGQPLFADYQESKASDNIRRNRVSTNLPTDRYVQIENGLDLYVTSRNDKSNNDINVSDAIRLVRKAYYNFSDLRNILDVLTEFSTATIYYRGGTAKSRNFFESLSNKIGIMNLQQKFFMEYYRSCNVIPYRFESKVRDEDLINLNKTFGTKAAKNIKLPSKYIIIDPSSVTYGGNINFANPLFYQKLNPYEIQRLIKPITQDDKDFLASLPPEIQNQLSKSNGINQSLNIPLDPDYTYFIFYKKQDYEPMAAPMCFPVLRHINAKAEMQNIDLATNRTIMRAVLHIAMGFENKNGEIFIDQKAMEAMRKLFESESIGKILVTDFATKIEWKIPDISKLLGPEKYKQLNEDIKNGLNNILSSGADEKFANQSIKVKLFIERLQQSREVFLNEFWIPEMKRIGKLLNFKSIPTPKFADIDFKDEDLFSRILAQLAGMGYLTPEEVFESMETGKLPDAESSAESQRNFKKLKDEGLYMAVQQNPAGQLTVLDKQGKQQQKTLEMQQEHISKEATKQRNHEINNPKPEAPQIHINAPAIKNAPGKPAGTRNPGGLKKKTAKPISASLIKENLILATKANTELEQQILSKFKVKKLNDLQVQLKDTLLDTILASENSSDWSNKEIIASYLDDPNKINKEKYEEVRAIGELHNVDDYLASVIHASLGKEDIEVKE